MLTIRRALQVVALVGTLMIGVVAVALIVSQTSWFRDWLRRYIVRESKQYVNGELSIGGLSGNLLFGVGLSDVAVDVSGQRVVAVKALQVDYSVVQILSSGIVIDDIKIIAPTVRVERDASGWNLGRLVREQQQEADRKGPMRPISLPSIELTDGTVEIADKTGSTSYRLPSHVDGLHVKGSFEYAPVHYSVRLEDVHRGHSLVTPGAWTGVAVMDVRLVRPGADAAGAGPPERSRSCSLAEASTGHVPPAEPAPFAGTPGWRPILRLGGECTRT